MFVLRGTRRGLRAPQALLAAGVTVTVVLALPAVAWAGKSTGHKGGSTQQPGATTTTAPSTSSTTTSSTTTSSTTTTTAPPPPDTTPPTASISAPAAGSTVSGTVGVSGSAADNVSVASVRVAVDGAAWQTATGTTSWTWWWPTSGLADGSHTVAAQAVDTSGNLSAIAYDTVTVSNGSSPAPATQGTWTSPEGATISVNSTGTNPDTGKPWTIADVYGMLKAQTTANSTTESTFLELAPHYTVAVQDTYPSETQVSYWGNPGSYSFQATTYLQGDSGTTFAAWPDYVLSHEYGMAWTQYFWVMNHNADWSPYLGIRLDGSTYNGAYEQYLGQDPRLWSSLTWDGREIIADDYRLLFGSSAAISESATGVNTTIVDPRSQAGLSSWLLQQWA